MLLCTDHTIIHDDNSQPVLCILYEGNYGNAQTISQVPRPTLGSRSGERTPWERLFFLPGPLAPKMLLLPPHTTYIIGFLCTWLGPGHRRNFWNSILAGATADLDAHPVCPLARTTHIYSISLSFLHGFATRGHFVFLTIINHCSRGTVAALKHTFHHWFTK